MRRTKAQRLILAAKAWVGTPYLHQASAKGAGCDCLGLIRGVWREVHGDEPAPVPPYTPDWSEPQGEERLWAEAARLLRPGKGRPGDLLLFRMREGGVQLLDTQQETEHMTSLGQVVISRADYVGVVHRLRDLDAHLPTGRRAVSRLVGSAGAPQEHEAAVVR